MANNNRTEVAAAIEALAAIVDLEELKEVLNDNFAQSLTFRKDVTTADTAAAATKTLDFVSSDYITVTQSANVTYTLSNILQGEIKYLKITKSAGQTIAFTGATDVSVRRDYIDNTVTNVIYKITNKDGSLYVESQNIDNKRTLQTKVIDIGDWDMDTNATTTVNHGLSDHKKIRAVSGVIRDDNDTNYTPFTRTSTSAYSGVGTGEVDATLINLIRITGGTFDSTSYDQTSFNRGWVTIWYEE